MLINKMVWSVLRFSRRILKYFIYSRQTVALLILFLFLQLSLGGWLASRYLFEQVNDNLEETSDRIREDIILRGGKWDLALYNADNRIPPNDSVYIITSDGFVVERSNPIHGLLDLSRYSLIAAYSTPTTLESVTNESWRLLSSPILSQGQPVGSILVAIYDPDITKLSEIDRQLQEAIEKIKTGVFTKGDEISTEKLDVRTVPFNISFQVVNRFNRVILQNENNRSITRIPVLIDRSYVDNKLKDEHQKLVEDDLTHKKYLTLTVPLYDEKNLVAGIIVLGRSVDFIYSSLSLYTMTILLTGILLITIFMPIFYFYQARERRKFQINKTSMIFPKEIVFAKKNCKLSIDGQKVDIPYASYQYYFCNSLFSKPQKKWEVDELLEIFGEDFGLEKWRKVYDTMTALNRKTSSFIEKLFVVENKRYFINSKYLQVIQFMNT